MSRRGNTKEVLRQLTTANAEPQQATPQTFHMTSADFRNPAYDFRPFENWIAQVSGERALQDAVNLAHRYMRQALAGDESAATPQIITTDESNQLAESA